MLTPAMLELYNEIQKAMGGVGTLYMSEQSHGNILYEWQGRAGKYQGGFYFSVEEFEFGDPQLLRPRLTASRHIEETKQRMAEANR